MADKVLCPKCHSDQITANKKGANVKNAVIGGLLLGPFGLAFGALGRNKVMITCLACGYTWPAGHPVQGVDPEPPAETKSDEGPPRPRNLAELHQQ